MGKLLSERISHERELREAEKSSFDHERELRAMWDAHERELRLQAESAVEKARDMQFDEYARRLGELNNAHERERQRNAESVTRSEFLLFKDDLQQRTELAAKEVSTKHEQVIDSLSRLSKQFDDRLKDEMRRLDERGSSSYREAEALHAGRDAATNEILAVTRQTQSDAATNRRWLIGLYVTVAFGIIASLLTFVTLVLHLLKVY